MKAEPIIVSLRTAAEVLDCSVSRVRQLADEQAIDNVYDGRIRKVTYASLKRYAANLSKYPPAKASA